MWSKQFCYMSLETKSFLRCLMPLHGVWLRGWCVWSDELTAPGSPLARKASVRPGTSFPFTLMQRNPHLILVLHIKMLPANRGEGVSLHTCSAKQQHRQGCIPFSHGITKGRGALWQRLRPPTLHPYEIHRLRKTKPFAL